MQHLDRAEVRRALQEGTYVHAFRAAEEALDGLSLREALDVTLQALEEGDAVLYDALAARWIVLTQLQGRASLSGVHWLAGRFDEIIDPVRRSTDELYAVLAENPQARFRARRLDELSPEDAGIVERRNAADLARLDSALSQNDLDAAWELMTPATPLDRFADLVFQLARGGDARFPRAGRRLHVRFTIEAGSTFGVIAEHAAALEAARSGSPERLARLRFS